MLTIGNPFPEFNCQACVGLGKDDFAEITNATDAAKWKLFIFYPKDFTFICPTELVEFGKRVGDFSDRDVVLYGGSTDNEFAHRAWRNGHDDLRTLPYPLIAAQRLAHDLGILDPKENVCLRATFLVDPHGIIQFASAYNLSVGRSVDEVIRVVDAVQSDELCPCNWQQGDAHLVT